MKYQRNRIEETDIILQHFHKNMTNLLFNFKLRQPENATSDILAYLLNGIPVYREAFLTGIRQYANKDGVVERERTIGKNCRPDFVIEGEKWIIAIENKPWDISTFSSQLADYTKALKTTNKMDKYLCLLTTERDRIRLLQVAAAAEGINVPDAALETALQEYYDKRQLHFSVLTWDKLLKELGSIQPENEAAKLWFKALEDYILPPLLSQKDLETKEDIIRNWSAIKSKVDEIRKKVQGKQQVYGYDDKGSNTTGSRNENEPQRESGFWGWFLYDRTNSIKYWIGADIRLWGQCQLLENPEYCLFYLSTWIDNKDSKNALTPLLLKQCGFIKTGKNEYSFPLIRAGIHYEDIDIDKVSRKAIEILNKVRDALAD